MKTLPDTKQCSKCKQVKPRSEFNKCSRLWHGLQPQCRQCEIERRLSKHPPKPIDPDEYVKEKICTICKQTKKFVEFSNGKTKDGKQFRCKQCMKEWRASWVSDPEIKAKEQERGRIKQLKKIERNGRKRDSPRKFPYVICQRCKRYRVHASRGYCAPCYRFISLKENPELDARDKEKKKIRSKRLEPVRAIRRKLQRVLDPTYDQKMREWARTSRNRHPETRRRSYNRRRSRLANLPYDLTETQWLQIVKDQNCQCHYCGWQAKDSTELEQEHKIPVSRGGGYTASNITTSCLKCNRKKHNKTEDEFIAYMRLHPQEFPYAVRIP